MQDGKYTEELLYAADKYGLIELVIIIFCYEINLPPISSFQINVFGHLESSRDWSIDRKPPWGCSGKYCRLDTYSLLLSAGSSSWKTSLKCFYTMSAT